MERAAAIAASAAGRAPTPSACCRRSDGSRKFIVSPGRSYGLHEGIGVRLRLLVRRSWDAACRKPSVAARVARAGEQALGEGLAPGCARSGSTARSCRPRRPARRARRTPARRGRRRRAAIPRDSRHSRVRACARSSAASGVEVEVMRVRRCARPAGRAGARSVARIDVESAARRAAPCRRRRSRRARARRCASTRRPAAGCRTCRGRRSPAPSSTARWIVSPVACASAARCGRASARDVGAGARPA